MTQIANIFSLRMARAIVIVGLLESVAKADELFINVDKVEVLEVIQEAPVVADVVVFPAVGQGEVVKAPDKIAQQKPATKIRRLAAPIWYPTIYPNPLAFNMIWVTITDRTFAQARVLASAEKLRIRRPALAVAPQPNAAAQNVIQQQMRKFLEPMLTVELSFAARATGLKLEERRRLNTDGKAWFEKFVADFMKKQDPNQQRMLMQGMQGVWFGNGQQKVESPRDAIRAGVAKLMKDTLSEEKMAAYTDECLKRDEFARQVAVDNLVERIDEKVKLSPDQWKKIAKSLNDHWDKSHVPQLESFTVNRSMWTGAPDQWVLPELTPAQQAVLKRINNRSGQVFINGGIFGRMFGGNVAVFDDMDVDLNVEVVGPAPGAVNPEPE
jgi:hypothetical protein